MLRLLYLFISLNLFSAIFCMEEKEETPSKRTPEEQLSLIEKLPTEVQAAFIDKILDPIIDELKEKEINLINKYKIPSHETSEDEATNSPQLLGEDFEQLFVPINQMIEFRSIFSSVSKKFLELRSYIDSKVIKEIKSLNPNIKNLLIAVAVHKNYISIISLLLKTNIDLNLLDPDGNSLLIYAVQHNFADIVNVLLKNGANPNISNKEGFTPLHIAVDNNSLEMVKLLIEKGAEVDPRERLGKTPLGLAYIKGYREIADYLIAHGAQKKFYLMQLPQ